MKYEVVESKDIGDIVRFRSDTLSEALTKCRELNDKEDLRWEGIKRTRPDFPREALSYFNVVERK